MPFIAQQVTSANQNEPPFELCYLYSQEQVQLERRPICAGSTLWGPPPLTVPCAENIPPPLPSAQSHGNVPFRLAPYILGSATSFRAMMKGVRLLAVKPLMLGEMPLGVQDRQALPYCRIGGLHEFGESRII